LKNIKEKLVQMSIMYYGVQNPDAKMKVKNEISKIVKKSHKFRETNKEDYEFITNIAKNIT
jgi:hypothetical protein|tara:strand:- start:65 stop:247 length:183 start_codon:yes stop_codon:yes gene_type:complete